MPQRLTSVILGLFLTLSATTSAIAVEQSSPTPFPDAKNEAAWPGTGPIRVHPWMVDNRAWFWTQRTAAQGSIVFVGDSLTGNWAPKEFAAAFPGLKVANRGIGGDVSRGVLFRLGEDVLSLHPTAMVLCIGTNDLSCHADTAGVMANIAAIIDQARKQDPALPIVLCTIPPREVANAPTKPGALDDLNTRIATYAKDKPHLLLLDLHALLGGPVGELIPENFAQDKIHLAGPGYQKWAAAIKPLLAKLLPPAPVR